LPSSFPGCPETPLAPPAAALPETSSASVGDDVQCERCHVPRLDRFSFAAGTRFSLACAREVVPSLRSSLPTALRFLGCYSTLYPPSYRVYVSLSSGFRERRLLLRPSFHRWLLAWSPTRTPVSENLPMVTSFH